MQISGFGHIHQAHSVRPTQQFEAVHRADQASNAYGPDELDISAEAQSLSQTSGVSEVRANRVAEIKAQIQNGTYETPEKLELALEKMLDSIG